MSRALLPLKTRVRYEGRVHTLDRRPNQGAEFEKLPDHFWYVIGQVLRSKFRKPILTRKGKSVRASKAAAAAAAAQVAPTPFMATKPEPAKVEVTV